MFDVKNKTAIRLAYWRLPEDHAPGLDNYGDMLSPYIVEHVSGRRCEHYNPRVKRKWWARRRHLAAIGSILRHCEPNSLVWGTGIISRQDQIPEATFHAVRGPETRERISALGYQCPEVYGDPALLLPRLYSPAVERTHALGVIPHIVDYDGFTEAREAPDGVRTIRLLTDDLERTTREILACKRIISSSLHGMIVAHAYGIPATWVRFSESLAGDDVKFADYLRAVEITPYTGPTLSLACTLTDIASATQDLPSLPSQVVIERLQEGLLASFPCG